MSKDINIHLKTRGTQQAKQELDEAGKSVEKIGEKTEQTGRKTGRASAWIVGSLKKIGTLGFLAIGTAIAAAAGKVAKFFDTVKTRSDEAVREVQEIRAAYESLFEALDAFDEKSRQATTKATNLLLQKTGVTQEMGLPVVNAYTRQFKSLVGTGQITQQQYDQGLQGMLGYAARHGGEATTELISIMRGWDMVTPQKQGEFRRMISKGAQITGLTDEEVIGALGRGMPTIKAMGWTPEQAVANIALLASGETGRKKMSLPSTTLDALMAPQLSDIEKLGIPEDVTKDPQKLLAFLSAKQPTMDRQKYLQLLTQVYGREAATGVYKLMTVPQRGIQESLRQAAAAEGIAAEQAEEDARKTTLEYRDAVSKARARQIKLDITEEEVYAGKVREIGFTEQKRRQRYQEKRQQIREWLIFGIEAEKEQAAYLLWKESLTPEEREAIYQEYQQSLEKDKFRISISPSADIFPDFEMEWKWRQMSQRQRWENLTRIQRERRPFSGAGYTGTFDVSSVKESGPVSMNYDYRQYNYRIFNPVVGVNKEDLGMGPVVPRDLA